MKRKARLAAKGYHQKAGIDYQDSFSLVAKQVIVRLLFALSAAKGWQLHQLDINNAFLHGTHDQKKYTCCHQKATVKHLLDKSVDSEGVYIVKQASRQWNEEFSSRLRDFGFKQSQHDNCLYAKDGETGYMALLIYVDDVLVTGNATKEIEVLKDYLQKIFTIKDLGKAKYFLGLEIARTSEGMYINQHKYALDIISDARLLGAKLAKTPMVKGTKLSRQ